MNTDSRHASTFIIVLATLTLGALALVCFAPPARAGDVHTFTRQLAGTCENPSEAAVEPSPCPGSKLIPFGKPLTGTGPPALTVGPVGPEESATEKSALFMADRRGSAVDRFSATGAALPFECLTKGECPSDVEANRLTGTSATGTGTLTILDSGAGTLTAGSKEVTDVETTLGAFAVGEEIAGAGIPGATGLYTSNDIGTTITKVGPGATLTLSQPATQTGHVALTVGSKEITGITTTIGHFSVGQELTAPGLPPFTKITAVLGGGALEVSLGATTSESVSLVGQSSFKPETNSIDGTGVAGVDVDDATGEIFALTEVGVDIFSPAGADIGQVTEVPVSSGAEVAGPFNHPAGVAFDQETGELYLVAEGGEGGAKGRVPAVVDVFKREAPGVLADVRQFGSGAITGEGAGVEGGGAQTVAVAEGMLSGVEPGTVYVPTKRPSVGDVGYGAIDVFSSLGTLESTWTGAATPAGSFGGEISVTVDPSSGHVYVADVSHHVVDEFASSTSEAFLGQVTGTPTGAGGAEVPFARPEAAAVSRTSGDLSVEDYDEGPESTEVIDQFSQDLPTPEVKAEAPSQVGTTSAVLHGTVTLASERATCRFVWGTSASEPEHVVPCEPEAVAGEEGEVAVHADLNNLTPGTSYYYKLRATNTVDGEENSGAAERPVEFTTLGPQFIEVASVSDVASTSVTFRASVGPSGAPTSAFVEYGPCPSSGSCAASPFTSSTTPQPIGSGEAAVPVEWHVQGLQAGTSYHYRTAAASEVEGRLMDFASLVEGTFTTQAPGGFGLPDGRAWEMVTPPDKQGTIIMMPGLTFAEGMVLKASSTGNGITYQTNAPTEPGVSGFAVQQQDYSSRGAGGWSTVDLGTPHPGPVGASVGAGSEYRFFSEDLSRAFLQPFGKLERCQDAEGASRPCLTPAASEQTAFMRDQETGLYMPLVTGCPGEGQPCPAAVSALANVPEGSVFSNENACPPAKYCGPFFDGASPDGEHAVLWLGLNGQPGLYEWNEKAPPSEQLRLVGALPGQSTPAPGITTSLGSKGGGIDNGLGDNLTGAVSADGERVFWSNGGGDLYLRYNATQPASPLGGSGECLDARDACTIQVGSGPGTEFVWASSNGSRVFYTEEARSLYVCELAETAPECHPVELGDAGAFIGSSEDGSYAYWVSESSHLLYEAHFQEGRWQVSRVAALSPNDSPLEARVSPNGRWLAFLSERPFTGYDNRELENGQPVQEDYLYDAETRRLACISCEPTGGRPLAQASDQLGELVGGAGTVAQFPGVGGWVAALEPSIEKMADLEGRAYQPRTVSDSGRVFFDSYDALVPKDIDGTWDVYEYEPEGAGDCGSSAASGSVVYKAAHSFDVEGQPGEEGAGCVGLISSGEASEESALLDASQSGGDVFFITNAKLSTADYDNAYDIYDAHECTASSPCIPPPPTSPPQCTTAEGCRAEPEPQPSLYGAPPSATFDGLGNPPAATEEAHKSAQKPKRKNKHKKSHGAKRGRRVSRARHARRAHHRGRH